MQKSVLASAICFLLIFFIRAEEHKESTKEKVMGVIRDLACFSCRANVGAFSYLMFNPISIKGIEASITLGCTVYTGNYQMCLDNAIAYVTLVAGVEEETQRILHDKPDFIKDNEYINNLYKEIKKDKEQGRSRETLLLYHFADFHFQFDYKEGTNNDCADLVCCNERAGEPKNKEKAAGKWGDYNCDSNPAIFGLINDVIKRTGEPDLIVWTGDTNDHGIQFSADESLNNTFIISKELDKMFPRTKIFPIHGNHEFAPKNSQDFSAENVDIIAKKLSEGWRDWLTPEVEKELREKSFYSYESSTHPKSTQDFKTKIGKTRLIALNTQNCYTCNFFLIGEMNDPGQEFGWLESQLKEMEKNGEVAIIFGHIPPGESDCTSTISARMRALYDRYQHVIRLNIFGHTHLEEYEIVRSIEDKKPVGVIYFR